MKTGNRKARNQDDLWARLDPRVAGVVHALRAGGMCDGQIEFIWPFIRTRFLMMMMMMMMQYEQSWHELQPLSHWRNERRRRQLFSRVLKLNRWIMNPPDLPRRYKEANFDWLVKQCEAAMEKERRAREEGGPVAGPVYRLKPLERTG